MTRREGLLAYFLVAAALIGALMSRAADTRKGDWTLHSSDEPGKVEFALIHTQHGNSSHHSSSWPLAAFVGLEFSKSGKQEVKFHITRDAGRFDCQGFLDNGDGAGVFQFFADAKYANEMKTLGFTGIDDDKQYTMAIMDVSLSFAREMKDQHLRGLDTDKLIEFRIFNVDSKFIQELRSAGLSATDCDKLVAFRIHGVTSEMVRFLHQDGYQPDEDTLIAMRIHGATPEWIQQLQKEGYDHVDLQKLIAFRIHGVSRSSSKNCRAWATSTRIPINLSPCAYTA